MPRKKKTPNNFSKLVDKKIPLEDLPLKTIKVTIHALRWIFLLVFLFLIIGTFILLATGGQQYFQMIVGFGLGFLSFIEMRILSNPIQFRVPFAEFHMGYIVKNFGF